MDNNLLNEIHMVNNHSESTKKIYRIALRKYTAYFSMSMNELIEEAEQEEENGIRMKKRKIKTRLLTYRHYLLENYSINSVRTMFYPIIYIYNYLDIETPEMPKINLKSVMKSQPIRYKDLPDKEIIRKAVKLADPEMTAIIYFMASSGCARRETLNLTIQDYIDSLSEYTNKNNIYEIINELGTNSENIIPTFNILRQKTGKYYTTYCSPEAVNEINIYLLSRNDKLKPEKRLFNIQESYLLMKFRNINNLLGLGRVGAFHRFRSHMLRKFHASALYNDGMSLDKVNDLQGKAKNKTDSAYFMTNPDDLKNEYIAHLSAITINKEVEKITIKSKEYRQLEKENYEKNIQIETLMKRIAQLETYVFQGMSKTDIANMEMWVD